MDILPQLILVVILVFLNGFFVASEFALVAVRKTRIDELVLKNNIAAKYVQSALNDLETYISATQLGITLASLALGWVGEPTIAHYLEPYFAFMPQDAAFITAHTLAVAIAFTTISFLHIVFGELAPKSIALQKAESTSLYIIAPLSLFTRLFKPFIFVLNGAGILVLKLIGFKGASGHQIIHSEAEIRMILAQSGQGGVIERGEVKMVENVFNLGDMSVKSIMVPRTDIIALDFNMTLNDVITKVEKDIHSRFPVYESSVDTIIGFVHIKDIYKSALKKAENNTLSEINIIRKIISMPESKKADDALLEMRKRRIHLAVVTDEFGGTAGIVTLEDIIESLVGEIQDEFDKPLQEIHRQKNGTYLIDGLTHIETVREKFRIPMKGQGYTTIGGLVIGILGRDPQVGDSVQIGSITLKIETMSKKRIRTIRLIKENKAKKK